MAATGTPTPNIGLRIPIGTDPASVDDINYNSNLLDTKLGAVGSDSVQDQLDTLNGKMIKVYTFTATTDATYGAVDIPSSIGKNNAYVLSAVTDSINDISLEITINHTYNTITLYARNSYSGQLVKNQSLNITVMYISK